MLLQMYASTPLFTAPSDYTGGHYSVTIPALKKEGKVSVLTAKNETLEPDEHFIATLHVPEHPKLSTGLTTAVITINDRTSGLIQKWLRMCNALILRPFYLLSPISRRPASFL